MHSWLTRCTTGLSSAALVGAALLLPAPAQAAGTDVVVSRPSSSAGAPAQAETKAPVSKEVEVEQTSVEVAPAPEGKPEVERHTVEPFRMAGVTWDADSQVSGVTVRMQVRENGEWTQWQKLDIESRIEGGRPGTAPLWTGAPADAVAVEVTADSGTPSGVKVTTIDPGKAEVVTPVRSASYDPTVDDGAIEEIAADGTPSVVPMPSVITRSQWKAGAGTSCSAPVSRPKALGVVMHHTAGSNTYSKAESAGIVRSYQTYHVKGHGWCDIGYNFLVDRFGQIFEGRKGGMTNQIRAAHSGVDAVNQYATGISMMGHFDYVKPSAAMQSAVVKLVGWRLKYFGANPKGTYSTGGRTYKVITGHRDVVSTACPGKYGYQWLNQVGGLRDRVATYISKASKAAGAPSTAAPTYTAPASVRTSVTPTSVTVSWKAVSRAPGYRILISPTGTTKNARYYRTAGANSTHIRIAGLQARRVWKVRLAVYDAAKMKRVGPWTAAPGAHARTPAFPAVSGVKAAARGTQSLKVTWTAQAGAPGYRAQLLDTVTGKKRYLASYTNSATFTGLRKASRYRVRVAVIYPATKERVSAYTKAPYPILATAGTSAPAPKPAPKPSAPSVKNTVTPSSGAITFKGHGYGHGIGMSQYGAEGGARAGQKYTQILAKYYPGTKLSTKSARIRVLLSGDTTDGVRVKTRSGLKFRKIATNAVSTLPAKVGGRTVTDWAIDPKKGDAKQNTLNYMAGSKWYAFTHFAGDGQFEGPTSIALVMPSGATQSFRGALRSSRHSTTKRDTINVLTLEDYTRGVVAREMPSSWSLEALKAQSVAARTYGSRYLGSSRHYDICDTTSCQVYGGVSAEATRTNQAVDGTRGKILTHGGAPALTQFSSSSGGYTNAGSAPYLKAVADPWDDWSGNKMHAWTQKVTAATIQRKYAVGTLRSISITRRNGLGEQGGRVVSLTIKGSKGSKTITGVDARWAFGLKSDWFGF